MYVMLDGNCKNKFIRIDVIYVYSNHLFSTKRGNKLIYRNNQTEMTLILLDMLGLGNIVSRKMPHFFIGITFKVTTTFRIVRLYHLS